jgi:hypothetical protein
MGECSLVQPITTEEVRLMMGSLEANISDLRNQMVHVKGSVDTNISDLRDQVVHVKGTVQDLVSVVSTNMPLSGTANVHHANSATGNLPKETQTSRLTIKIPALATLGTSTSKHNTAAIGHPPSVSVFVSNHAALAARTGTSCRTTAGGHRRTSSRSLPTAGLIIPDVPIRGPNGSRRPRSESWRDIVKHWVEGDPALGLHTPLRDWPPEWTRGSNRLFAAKYHQRSLIALEFLDT